MRLKVIWIAISALIVLITVATSCSGTGTSTATASASTQATTSASVATTPAPKPSTPAASTTPKSGGSIVRILNQGPAVLGYPPEMGPNDAYSAWYYLDPLFFLTDTGFEGALAQSWDINQNAKTITFHLRQGVKYQDGTPMDAESIKWNFELFKTAKKPYFTDIVSYDIADPYTLKLNLSNLDITTLTFFSALWAISPTAYQKSGATEDDRKVWARANPVGTGPYKVVDYKRDAYIDMQRNPDYWRPNRPYIDHVKINIIPDVTVASALIASGQADVWAGNNNMISSAIDLEKKGFGVKSGALSMTPILFFNSDDPKSVWSNPAARQAVEYAINRPQLAKLVGSGYYVPATQLSQAGYYSYNAGFDPRPYNPDKAKQLLQTAGLTGIKTSIETIARDQDTAAAIQAYLKAVGIDATLDIADTARYYQIYTQGWSDLCIALLPLATNSNEMIFQMGSKPMNFKKSIWKSPEFLNMANQALASTNYEDIKPLLQQMVRQVSVDAQYVPLYSIPYTVMYQKSFHTTYLDTVSAMWKVWDDWTENTK
jgi:peptide/nickel transport system substrate-binding protein